MPTIKERIKQLRKEKGLTQEELAKMLGLSAKSNIANYESGANSPSDEIKIKMCEIFGCTMDYLMGLTDYKNAKEDLEKQLYELNLTEEDFENLISLVKNKKLPNIKYLFSKEHDKFTKACKICSLLDWEYTIPYEPITNEQENELKLLLQKNRELVINTILSLDKGKILHPTSEIKGIDLTGLDDNDLEKVQEYANLIKYRKNQEEKSSQ